MLTGLLLVLLTLGQQDYIFCYDYYDEYNYESLDERADDTCVDRHSNCITWALTGECEDNPDYMLVHCQRACKVCESDTCVDRHSNCKAWALTGQCVDNPDYMLAHCQKACGACKPVCKDNFSNCTALAAEGECHFFNYAWMRKYCALSCRICKPIPTKPTTTTEAPTTTTEPALSCNEFSGKTHPLKYCHVCIKKGHCVWDSEKNMCIDSDLLETHDRFVNDSTKCGNDWVITDLRCEQVIDLDISLLTRCRLCLQKEECFWNSDVKSCVYIDDATVSPRGWINETEKCTIESLPKRKTSPCKDNHRLCNHWKEIGGCSQHPKYMRENCKVSCNLCLREADCEQIIPGNSTWTTAAYCTTCSKEVNCVFSVSENSCVEDSHQDSSNYIRFPETCQFDSYEFGCFGYDVHNIGPTGSRCEACLSRQHCLWSWEIMNCVNREFVVQDDQFNDDPSLCGNDIVNTACNERVDNLKNLSENCLSCTEGKPLCTFVKDGDNYNCVRRNISIDEIFDGWSMDKSVCSSISTKDYDLQEL